MKATVIEFHANSHTIMSQLQNALRKELHSLNMALLMFVRETIHRPIVLTFLSFWWDPGIMHIKLMEI